MTTEPRKCLNCGAELPPGAPGGHCPQCLIKLALSDEPPPSLEKTVAVPLAAEEQVGDTIGRYKLLEQIGEGGFGVVYAAEQKEPVRRRVALKVIKLGMDTKQVVARFEAERQALAMMDHPNIAKVLDAGATDKGRPFFVMELVRGITITRYCDQNKLPMRERLDLFMQVCRAIQHAHQKGIIHRDIKPSNILVTLHDGVPVPKVIDFGIAKATQGSLTDATIYTQFQQFIGTPAYMSPEQAEMSGLDIDTRSDIYSLGVLLYELLAGKTPFDQKALLAAGLDEMRRIIREAEPVRPSTRISTLKAEEQTTMARQRQSEPPKLVHLVRGDLDCIVMKCLEKDRTHRYETSNGLAMDIGRFLNHEPIVARPPSNLYRFQKMVRRNRFAFGAAAAVGVSLILGLAISSCLFIREKQARANEARMRGQAEAARKQAQAEAARAEAAALQARMTLATSDYLQAGRLIAEDDNSDALAYLVRSLSGNPSNEMAMVRLCTLLSYQCWMVPVFTLDHSNTVWSAQFSPDGQQIVTAAWDNTARVWDGRNGQPLTGPLQHAGRVWSVQFSPDGNRVVTGSCDGVAQVWDAHSGQALTPPLHHGGMLHSAQFSPEGKRVVTASEDKTARVWDAQSGEPLTGPLQHGSNVLWAVFSPDGNKVVTASKDNTARVWDARSGQPLTAPLAHSNIVNSASFSPDGRSVLTDSWDGTARLWDAQTGLALGAPFQHAAGVLWAEFSPDGNRIVTASYDRTARVWDLLSGRPLTGPLAHGGTVLWAGFSPDGTRVLTASADNAVCVWDAWTGLRLTEPLKHTRLVNSAQFSPDGQHILTSSDEQRACLWEALSEASLAQPFKHEGAVNSAQFSPDGTRVVTASADYTARLWDASSGQPQAIPLTHLGAVNSAEFSPDGLRIVTASQDKGARVWETRTGSLLAGPLMHDRAVTCAQFSPDGQRILTASEDKTARLWEAQTGRPLTQPLMHSQAVLAAQFSPDGRWLLTVAADNLARVWDAHDGRPRTPPLAPGRGVTCAQFSPDSQRIVSASRDYTARVWDAQTGRETTGPLQHGSFVCAAQFSPDGTRIVTASLDHTARVWDAHNGQLLAGPLQHEDNVTWAQFSPDGRCIATASSDGTARVWDSRSGLPLTEPLPNESSVLSARFSPDGRRLLAVTGNAARVWDIAPLSTRCPAWLLELAEAVSGQALEASGLMEPTALNRSNAMIAIRHKLSFDTSDEWSLWGRWLLADRATRTISPFSTVTVAEYIEDRIREQTTNSLAEAERLAHGDSGTLIRIAQARLAREKKTPPRAGQ